MTTIPASPSPSPYPSAPLTQPHAAFESSRDAGYDLSAAAGELFDNSYEAGAEHIRVGLTKDKNGSVTDLAVADNGAGIKPTVLASILSLGFSTRYGNRTGLGRFGMGLKLASLSQARRVEVYSRVTGQADIFMTYLDLQEIQDRVQEKLTVVKVADWPADFAKLMQTPEGEPFKGGTLVVWRRIDRLVNGGRYGTAVAERLQDLKKFLARAYRRFIDNGLKIDFDGTPITLHDPSFLLPNPRVTDRFGDLRADIVDEGSFSIDGHDVKWTVALLPERLREKQGTGGRAGKGREEFADLYIPDNQGKISLLRNGREIYYDLVPKLYPGGRDEIDRYIGVEIEFPAALDEYFQVRNVKRGAEPVNKLREEMKKALEKPIKDARKTIRTYWKKVEQAEQSQTKDDRSQSHALVDAFDQTAPSGRANMDAPASKLDELIVEIITDLDLDPASPEAIEKADWVRKSFEQRAVTVLTSGWPGKDLFDIRHLTGKAIVRLNNRHPFMTHVMEPMRRIAELDTEEVDAGEAQALIRSAHLGLELLFIAYAKAENMEDDPDEQFEDLRANWGRFTAGLLREAERQG